MWFYEAQIFFIIHANFPCLLTVTTEYIHAESPLRRATSLIISITGQFHLSRRTKNITNHILELRL